MEDEIKKQCFNEIVSIRSGLSVFYENQQIIDDYLKQFDELEKEIYLKENIIAEEKVKIKDADDYLEFSLLEIPKLKDKQKEADSPTKPNGHYFVNIGFLFLTILLGLVALFGLFIILDYFIFKLINLHFGAGIAILVVFGFFTLCSACGIKDWKGESWVTFKEEKEKEVARYKQKINDINKTLSDKEVVKEKSEVTLKIIDDELKPLYSKRLELINKNESIKSLQKINETIYKNLEDNHQSIFCERDWAYIDLILFYINTGRADTVKEALLLVDLQVQTNQIVSAISSLSNQLTSILTMGIKYLGDVINSNFAMLSTQLNFIKGSIDRNSQLLIEEASLNRSFMNNLNVSCEKMTNELSKIKESSDKITQLDSEILKLNAAQLKKM